MRLLSCRLQDIVSICIVTQTFQYDIIVPVTFQYFMTDLVRAFIFNFLLIVDPTTTVTITGANHGESIAAYERLFCSANGFPEPDILWKVYTTGRVTYGTYASVQSHGRRTYECVASNLVNGASHQASQIISVYAEKSGESDEFNSH